MESFWVGADPGGVGNFGLAFLYDGPGAPDTRTATLHRDGVKKLREGWLYRLDRELR